MEVRTKRMKSTMNVSMFHKSKSYLLDQLANKENVPPPQNRSHKSTRTNNNAIIIILKDNKTLEKAMDTVERGVTSSKKAIPDAFPTSFRDSSMSPRLKQRKSKELRHTPWLATLWG